MSKKKLKMNYQAYGTNLKMRKSRKNLKTDYK